MHTSQTQAEIDAADKYHTWVRGWIDGTHASVKRETCAKHPTLGPTYEDGYAAGRKSRAETLAMAAQHFGHKPRILRAEHTGHETGGTSAGTNEGEEQ